MSLGPAVPALPPVLLKGQYWGIPQATPKSYATYILVLGSAEP